MLIALGSKFTTGIKDFPLAPVSGLQTLYCVGEFNSFAVELVALRLQSKYGFDSRKMVNIQEMVIDFLMLCSEVKHGAVIVYYI